MYRHAACSAGFVRLAVTLLMFLTAASAQADTANVMQSSKVLDFNLASAKSPAGEQAAGLTALDIDGDGQVSRAEAAGNAEVTLGFDRADRNRNGKVSNAEWQRYEKWQERRAKAREARLARAAKAKEAKASASAGASRAKPAKRSAP
jgi:hypothetical protein